MMATETSLHAEILRLFGTIDDHRIVEILDLNPTLEDMEITAAYLADMDDVMGEERIELSGSAAMIYDIVTRDETLAEDEYR